MTETINFYSTMGYYGFLSNFYRRPVAVGGKVYPTSEHFYQQAKFENTDPEWAAEISEASTPSIAKKMGNDRSHNMMSMSKWDSMKEDVMYEVLLEKFTQHDDLREKLVGTGKAILVEHTVNDSYWGDGGDGSGKNRLGVLLMKVRKELSQ